MRAVVFILISLVSVQLSAQENLFLKKALDHYKAENYTEARLVIDNAVSSEENQSDPKVWNFRGHVYKQLFKTQKEGVDGFRTEAVQSFKKSLELKSEGQYASDNKKALEYLSATLYNDAVEGVLKLKRNKAATDPVIYFQEYKELKLWMGQEDFSADELRFLKMIAQSYEKLHSKHDSEDRESITKAIDYYIQALGIDQSDYEANFNLAIIYYNEGARAISKIDYKTGLEELIQIQKECVTFFSQALPYMQTADELRPNRLETLKGLMFINRALNNFDTYLEYKARVDELLEK